MLQNNAATCLLVLAVILRLFVHASDICLWVVVSGAYFGNVYWVVMGADWHRCSIGTNEPVWRGPIILQPWADCRTSTNELIGEDSPVIIRLDANQ